MSVEDLKLVSSAFGAAKKVIDDAIAAQTPATTPNPAPSTPNPAPSTLILPSRATVTAEKLSLVMDEQFNSPTLDKKLWWDPYDGGPGSGTGGVGQRDKSLFNINNGMAVLGVSRPAGDPDVNHWKSVGIAAGPIAQVYGLWETRFMMPAMTGSSCALMLWMTNDNWPVEVEVDIAEFSADRKSSQTTIHYGKDNKQVTIPTGALVGDFTQMHTFTVEWLPNKLSFWLDGKLYWDTTNKSLIPTTPHHFVIQTDMGSWLGQAGPKDPIRVNLTVDYVRQWKILT